MSLTTILGKSTKLCSGKHSMPIFSNLRGNGYLRFAITGYNYKFQESKMLEKTPLELVKQGNLDAISALINRSLSSKGISAKVKRRDDCLQIMLESDQIPNQQNLTRFIQNGISKLEIQNIKTIQIFGRILGDEIPAWSQIIALEENPKKYVKKREASKTSLGKFQKK